MDRLIHLPEELRAPVAKAMSEWQQPLMFSLAERLQDLGVEVDLAVALETHVVRTWSCRLAYLGARILQRREPSREWWRIACEEDFDAAEKWFAENYTDAPPIEVRDDVVPPHDYYPSVMHMGDCAVCGNAADSPLHGKAGAQ